MISHRLLVTTLGSIASLALASACGGSGPPAPSSATQASRAGDARSTVGSVPAARAPDNGMVQISDEIRKACGIGDGDAFFAFDSVHLQNHDIPVLNRVATCFTTGPLHGRSVNLVGRADAIGPAAYNMELGLRRADSVSGYLIRQGMRPAQSHATSRGAADAEGTDDRNRSRDRRVDVLLGS
jgi:peptidoglycan-associated lipoprotein